MIVESLPLTQRREAERMPVAADGSFGETLVQVVELSLVGCKVIHLDRLGIGAAGMLRAAFSGVPVRVAARLVRSQLVFRGGAKFYESGLQFCASLHGAAADVDRALAALMAEQMPAPSISRAVEPAFDYLLCIRSPQGWRSIPTGDPHQPREGFTMPWPAEESEIGAYCKTYDVADADTRRMMRLSFELTIAEEMRIVH